MKLYCDEHEVFGEQRDDLMYHLRYLDQAFLEWSRSKSKKDREAQAEQARAKSGQPRTLRRQK